EKKDDQWNGSVVATAQGMPPGGGVANVSVTPDVIRFAVRLQGQDIGFEGKLPPAKDGKILGNITLGQQVSPAQLETTQLKSLDHYELSKETLAKGDASPELFTAAAMLVRFATDKKARPEEVRGWANKAFTAAAAYGPRWQQETALRLAGALLPQSEFAALALEYARKAERLAEANPN